MNDFNEQRICVKFLAKLGNTFTETHEMLRRVFGNQTLSRSQTHKWWQRFKNGRNSTDDDPRSGRPSKTKTSEIVAKVSEISRDNHHLTVREVAEEVNISKSACHEILTQKRILNNDSGDSKSRRKRKQDLSSVKSEQKPAKIVKIYPKIAPIEEVMIKEEPTNEPVEEVFIKQERFDEPIEEVLIKQERIDEHLEEKSIDAVENIVVKEERLDDYPTYSKAYDHLHSVIKTEQDDEEISQIPDQSL